MSTLDEIIRFYDSIRREELILEQRIQEESRRNKMYVRHATQAELDALSTSDRILNSTSTGRKNRDAKKIDIEKNQLS